MTIIQKKIRAGQLVSHKGARYSIASMVTDQKERRAAESKGPGQRIRGRLLGYEKPQITVHRIHAGKVLKSSNRYIGEDYKIIREDRGE